MMALRSAAGIRSWQGLLRNQSTVNGAPFHNRNRMQTRALPAKKGPADVPYRLGVTGSIGMGKSTIAGMFSDLKVPVLDSDTSVHELYAPGGAAVPVVQAMFPSAVVDGAVDRKALSELVLGDANTDKLAQLEAAVHPLVTEARDAFLKRSANDGHNLVVLDIPLLFEKDLEGFVDAVLVVTAPEDIQRQRCLEREGMTDEKLDAILARQVPDADKRSRADIVIDTSKDENFTRIEIAELVHQLVGMQASTAHG